MPETERFHLPSNESLYVDLKKRWSWGDTKAMEAARKAAGDPEAGAVAFADVLLTKAIHAWNLKDGDGNDLTISKDNIDAYMDGEDAQAVIQKAVLLRMPALAAVNDPNSPTA